MRVPKITGLRSENKKRGSMLIIALLFLTLLSLLGVTFAALMKLERKAARNFTDTQNANLVLNSAVDAVAAQLKGGMNYYHFTSSKAPWLFWDPKYKARLGAGRYKVEELKEDQFYFHGILEPVQGIARSAYRCKVLDCSSQINLNCGMDNLAMMIDNLGDAIARNPRIGFNPLYTPTRHIRGTDIVRYRMKLENGRFRNKSQLAEIIGDKNFEVLSDYVTVDSWVDDSTGKPEDTTELVLRLSNGGSIISTLAPGETYQNLGHSNIYGTHSLAREPRAPVDINTATEEVLTACFAGLACRRAFPFVDRTALPIGSQDTSSGFALEGNDRFPSPARGMEGGNEEVIYTVRPVWVYTPRITMIQAKRMAQAIIAERKQRPFVCWQAGRRRSGGFEDFVNTKFGESFFPRPQQVVVIDPLNPIRGTRYQGTIRAGGGANAAVRSLWSSGNVPMERMLRSQKGLPFHSQYAWFYETIKSAINANFNPNARLNKCGINMNAALVVDKSDLVSPWIPDLKSARSTPKRSEIYCGYTTEFSFDSGGYYEVTALAELDDAYDSKLKLAKPKIFQKARAVIKIFEVLRHTTQYDFAKQFTSGSFSSKRGRRTGREDVMTYPQPLIAATDYMSSGSTIDGNIQLMGNIDAEKVKSPSLSRDRWYAGFQNVLFGTSFMFRKSQEENQLIQRIKNGFRKTGIDSRPKGDVQNAMGGVDSLTRNFEAVLDGEYAVSGEPYRKRYNLWPSREGSNIVVNGADPSLSRVVQWPKFSETFLGFDNLRPDGLHTNIFNAPTRSCGIAMYPASAIIAGGGGGGGYLPGEHGQFSINEKRGNVSYYQGGVSFWIRFDFDAMDPIFCGLVGCTQVVRDVGQTNKNSEGNQFYIFKTSFGELRIVRMYYHRAFGTPSMQGSRELLPKPPDPDKVSAGAAGGKDKQDEIEPDVNKAYARSEVLVDISGWKKGEWHNIAVEWNDMNHSDNRVQVFIDSQAAESKTGITYGHIGEDSFCSLNTQIPYDELTVGGIIRRQAVANAGLFKFAYNLRIGGTTGGGSASSQSGVGGIGGFYMPWLKVFPANATIDEFVSFTGPYEAFRATKMGRNRGYFVRKGTYHNCFDVSFPRGVEALRLRSFNWTEYDPDMYHGASGGVYPMRLTQKTRAYVYLRSTRILFTMAPWLRSQTSTVSTNRIAGKVFQRPTGKGISQEAVKLVYRFDINAASGQGEFAGLPLGTPVIDDVTLTYFLPSTQLITWEDLPVDYQALEGKRSLGKKGEVTSGSASGR